MLLPKLLVFVAVLLPMAMSTAELTFPKKRSANSYTVEGCFSSFPGSDMTKDMGRDNSNIKCQELCRDQGYILAATKGKDCQCGNIYPKGQKVDDKECTTTCRDWSQHCDGPQSCCGGPSRYSVSVVGNIDVPKQVLRRLSHQWRTNEGYRNYMKKKVTISKIHSHIANWWSSFDSEGWSLCDHGRYMTGIYRGGKHNGADDIYLIEEARCVDAPGYLYPAKWDRDCYDHNWWQSFDRRGWSTCNEGYYMTGLLRTSGKGLHHIEASKCCRPRSQDKSWGHCYNLNVWHTFGERGWGTCGDGYYMTGLYRNDCDELECIEEFKCCKMGNYNGDSWVERPDLVIKAKDTSGQLKQCSMNAMDKTPWSETYHCNTITDRTNMLALNALSFHIEDDSPLNVAKPQPIEGFLPVICSAHTNSYKCTKWLTTAISTSSTFKIGTGFSSTVTVGTSVAISGKILG